MKKISLYYNTVRYLKVRQILFRMLYLTRNNSIFHKNAYKETRTGRKLRPIRLKPYPDKPRTWFRPYTFRFFNLKKTFQGTIDWNYSGYGRLWTYNLNYFDFLNQGSLSREEGLMLIYHFIASEPFLRDGKEPYPTSLRLVNWLKFIYRHNIHDQKINRFLLNDLHNLSGNVEYHLMANHLLENAIALTVGGYCLRHQAIYEKGMKLLTEQLDEQLCDDGGHYEKSPMYHQLLLERLLDTVNFLNDGELIRSPALAMLSWLETMTFQDGSIPHFNDSSPGVAASTARLKEYASALGLHPRETNLGNSGYRKLTSNGFELIADGGSMGPEYQPGHGHNDAGSFVLYVNNAPFIVDTGTSTYEFISRRAYERSVCSHNTTHPEGIEPSELWGSFRVGRRESVSITNETPGGFEVTRVLPTAEKHTLIRSFHNRDDALEIEDRAENSGPCKSYIHFSPDQEITRTDYGISTPDADLFIHQAGAFSLEDCEIATGFNQLAQSKKLVIEYSGQVKILIRAKAVSKKADGKSNRQTNNPQPP